MGSAKVGENKKRSLRQPLQVWLPSVAANPEYNEVRRDMARAFAAWTGEMTVWLIPGLDQEVRWTEWPFRCIAIPAEHLDRIDVYHIGKNGYACGYAADRRFGDGTVNGILSTFLSGQRPVVYPLPENSSVTLPRFEDGNMIGYREGRTRPIPASATPLKVDKESGAERLSWPPPGQPRTVSPDAESRDYYGPLRAVKDGDLMMATTDDGALRSLLVGYRWPDPLGELMHSAAGLDEMKAQNTMIQLAGVSANDPDFAFREAHLAAQDHVMQGVSIPELSWLWPTFAESDEQNVLVDIETRYGIEVETLDELFATDQAREKLEENQPIRRAWGGTGLCWALLLDVLEQGQRFNRCEECNGPIVGRRDKRFCAPADNAECARARQAEATRKSRNRNRT